MGRWNIRVVERRHTQHAIDARCGQRRARRSSSRRSTGLAAAVALFAMACGGGSDSDPATATAREDVSRSTELLPVPEPDLEGAEEQVGEQIRRQRAVAFAAVEAVDAGEGDAGAAGAAAEGLGDLGLLYFTYGFVGAAEASFRNAKLLAAEDHRWPYLLGYLLLMEGRLDEAASDLERALELEPDDGPSLLRLGNVRLELDEPESARELFERELELRPGSAPSHEGLGKVAAALGDHEAAVGHFEAVLEKQPSATSVHHALGLAHRNLGHDNEARAHLAEAGDAPVQIDDPLLVSLIELGRSSEIYLVRGAEAMDAERWDQAAALYRKAIDLGATDFMAHKALAYALEKQGDLGGALAQLDDAVEAGDAGDEDRNRRERAEIYRIMGGLEVLHGRENDAIGHFEASAVLDPENLDTRVKLGNALARQGRLGQALVHYDKILESEPDHPTILVKKGTALINLRRLDEGRASFERAVAAHPDDTEVRARYAEALDYLGDRAAAEQQRAAIGSHDLAVDEEEALLVGTARRQTSAGRFESALGSYDRVLETSPDNVDARFERARILGHLGRLDEAIVELQQVIDSSPSHGPARRAQITATLLDERYGEARGRLQDALAQAPRDRGLAHTLARLLATAPDTEARSGALAVEIAGRVFSAGQEPSSAETLAMAFAEAGQFDRALEIQGRLVEDAVAAGRATDAESLREKLTTYQQGRAWRLSSPDEIVPLLVQNERRSG